MKINSPSIAASTASHSFGVSVADERKSSRIARSFFRACSSRSCHHRTRSWSSRAAPPLNRQRWDFALGLIDFFRVVCPAQGELSYHFAAIARALQNVTQTDGVMPTVGRLFSPLKRRLEAQAAALGGDCLPFRAGASLSGLLRWEFCKSYFELRTKRYGF
jgi:hypothetical protein